MNRSRKWVSLVAAALAAPASVSAQPANHVSWGLAAAHDWGWSPCASPAWVDATYWGGGGWSLDVGFWATGHRGSGCDPWDRGLLGGGWQGGLRDCVGCGLGHAPPFAHDLGFGHRWHGHDGWRHGWHGHHEWHHHGSLAWRHWGRPLFGPPAWAVWPYRVVAAFGRRPFFFQAPRYFWGSEHGTWSSWRLRGFWNPGYVVAGSGYRAPSRSRWDDRSWRDRPVRRSPLFGPRYKEDPRVYVTDNGPERPTSRPVPRPRDGDWIAPPDGPERTGRKPDAARKAKPRNRVGSAAREPSRPTTTAGAARPTKPTARPTRPTARPAKPTARPARPTARPATPTARPARPTARPARPAVRSRPTAKARPTARVRAAPRPDPRRPTTRPAPTRTATAKPRPPRRSALPAPPASRRPVPAAKPAPRRPSPAAKRAPPRPPAPKRPARPRRPAKRGK